MLRSSAISSTIIMIPNASLIISFASIALAATVTSTSIPLNVTSNFVDVNNSTLNSSSPVIPKQNETLPIGHGAASLGLAPPPLGPVLAVISRLTPKEQKEFQSIIENDAKLTKKQLKENLAEFVKGLPESVQVSTIEDEKVWARMSRNTLKSACSNYDSYFALRQRYKNKHNTGIPDLALHK